MLRGLVVVLALVASVLASPSASAAEVRTCLSYEGAETDCWNRERWRYQFCYDQPSRRAFLQRYVNGNWRLVTEKEMVRDEGCPPDFPWELKVSRKAKRDGAQMFRWVLQYGTMNTDIYEHFTVSRTSR